MLVHGMIFFFLLLLLVEIPNAVAFVLEQQDLYCYS